MSKPVKILMAFLLILALPLSLLIAAASLPDFYGEAYYGALPELYHRLYRTEGKKLILIGGSSVAFGVDTQLLEDLLAQQGYDYTVCPFGLYAAVGTSVMLELAEDALAPGDVVVLTVEPTSETMSDYFGATAFWKCCESAPEMLRHLSKAKQSAMAGNYIPYLQERFDLWLEGNTIQPEGVYAKSSFDETGNLVYERAGNAMALGYDTSAPIDLAAVSIQPEFAAQVNEFCAKAASVGATVYFSFAPMNRSALTDEVAVKGYFTLCNETFACPIISDPNRYILDSGWFYDSNFHLNSAGAELRTCLLAEDLLAALGCYAPVDHDPPEMPDPIAQIEERDADASHFLLQAMGDGWLISGLTESGMRQTALAVPSAVDGKPVVGFTDDALTGADQLVALTLPESVESIPDGLFASCAKLERLILAHRTKLCSIGDDPFGGAPDLRIFVPKESYPLYRDGDGCEVNHWAGYLDRIYEF